MKVEWINGTTHMVKINTKFEKKQGISVKGGKVYA